MKSAVIVFPGSNCDRDVAVALEQVTGRKPAMVWHKDSALPDRVDFIALPGGFSYGDYLRSGAMAARSPIMQAVKDAAGRGVPVIGIRNGSGNVLGLMPHPERVIEKAHGGTDGRRLFEGLLETVG